MEIRNLSGAEFKTLVVRVFKELSEDLSSIKKTQAETKDTLIKTKNLLQGSSCRLDEAEVNSMIWNITKPKKKKKTPKKEKMNEKKNEDNVSSLWDNCKHSNICIVVVPEGEEKEQEIRNLFEKNERKFP